jgi:hypothetical protein
METGKLKHALPTRMACPPVKIFVFNILEERKPDPIKAPATGAAGVVELLKHGLPTKTTQG